MILDVVVGFVFALIAVIMRLLRIFEILQLFIPKESFPSTKKKKRENLLSRYVVEWEFCL
jgi:hypothetical protein